MKEKIYNPASTNETSPAEGMAAVNSFNSEEIEENGEGRMPKNFDTSQSREQQDDTHPVKKQSDD